MRFVFLLFAVLFCGISGSAQDSLKGPALNTVAVGVSGMPASKTAASFDSCKRYLIRHVLKLNVTTPGVFQVQKAKVDTNKDWLFYYLCCLLCFLGLLQLVYPRYFKDLFRFFFRTSLRVNQIKEQLTQSGLQSLLFNLFFTLSFGVFVFLLFDFYKADVDLKEALIPLVVSLLLMILYFGKYLFLKFTGWLLGLRSATESYTFIVFLMNKVAGVAIVPFLFVIAFSKPQIESVAVTIALVVTSALYLYRFLRAYQPVRSEVHFSRFHFLIYFVAVEVAPLLLIYKLLVQIL
jgi:hypothetical protein